MFRMSSRSCACVVWFGWMSRQTKPSLRIALPEFRPLPHHRSSAACAPQSTHDSLSETKMTRSALRLPLDSASHRSAAVRSAAADRSQLLGVRHHAIARIQLAPVPRHVRTAAPRRRGSSAIPTAATSAATSMQRTAVVAPARYPVTGTASNPKRRDTRQPCRRSTARSRSRVPSHPASASRTSCGTASRRSSCKPSTAGTEIRGPANLTSDRADDAAISSVRPAASNTP